MLKLTSADLAKAKIDTLVVPVCEDMDIFMGMPVIPIIANALLNFDFEGKKGEQLVLFNQDQVKAKRVVLMGIGKADGINTESMQAFAGKAVKFCIDKNLTEAAIPIPQAVLLGLEQDDLMRALMEGASLGNHIFDKYKSEKKKKPLIGIRFFTDSKTKKKYSAMAVKTDTICQGTIVAREWVSTPSIDKKPEALAADMIKLAEEAGIKVTTLNAAALKKNKCNAILGVGAGSASKPMMLIFEYGTKKADQTIAFIGKGVTFDAGGINLKSSAGLKGMKMDMSGAAAVAATMVTIANLSPDSKKINKRIIGVVPLVENMPSGTAIRPGDVLTCCNGKTIEIGNTDAEGRLILADAMAYAEKKFSPDVMIDFATLTGACLVALGDKIAGLFSNDDSLSKTIMEASRNSGDRCWTLPLPDDYKELLKSELADISNMSSSGYGGAITASLFLSEFVTTDKWAHIDIAGPAFTNKATAYCPAGGTGFGVRLMCELLDLL